MKAFEIGKTCVFNKSLLRQYLVLLTTDLRRKLYQRVKQLSKTDTV